MDLVFVSKYLKNHFFQTEHDDLKLKAEKNEEEVDQLQLKVKELEDEVKKVETEKQKTIENLKVIIIFQKNF